jgi:hypothetical protein
MAETSRFMNTEGALGEPYGVVHTVTAAEDTAGSVSVKTPFAIITGYIWQTVTSAGEKQEQDAYGSSTSSGTLTIVDGTHLVTATDVIHLLIWGKGGR